VKIEIEIPDENISNMLSSAWCWCGYWACTYGNTDATRELVSVSVLRELEEPGDEHGYLLGPTNLKKGITLCAIQSPHCFKMLLENNCDGPSADVIVQYALFGKVRFG
jgi:hypothetical protein